VDCRLNQLQSKLQESRIRFRFVAPPVGKFASNLLAAGRSLAFPANPDQNVIIFLGDNGRPNACLYQLILISTRSNLWPQMIAFI
jgi:hypothetical protein